MTDIDNHNFYLSGLNFEVTGAQLTIPGGDNTAAITANCNAELECPVEYAQHLFQYQTDAIDVQDLNVDDLKFRVFQLTDPSASVDISDNTYFNSRNLLITEAVTTSNAVSYYGSGSATIDEKKVGCDQARHIALKLFGTAEAVDIFNNERAFRLALLHSSVDAFEDKIDNIANVEWNGTDDHPAKAAFKQILANFPERLSTPVPHLYDESNTTITPGSTTTNLWYYMPFLAGDFIYFKLTIKPESNQAGILDESPEITDRTYLIKLKLVNAINLTTSANGAYMRPWDAAGPDFTIEPEYLQPVTGSDTVAP